MKVNKKISNLIILLTLVLILLSSTATLSRATSTRAFQCYGVFAC
jgi:hypothetical protein